MIRLASLLAISLWLAGCNGGSPALIDDPVFTPEIAQEFAVDTVHSSTMFKILHAGTAEFFGSFGKMSGTLRFAPRDLENSSVRVVIETASVDTNNPDRDAHVREVFEVEKYPQAIFEASNFRSMGGNSYRVDGTMTFHGVTQPLQVEAELVGSSNTDRFGPKLGFTARFVIDRVAFQVGPEWADSVLGTKVEVAIGIEANLQK